MAARNNRKQTPGAAKPRDPALADLMKQMLTQATTAAEMTAQIAGNTEKTQQRLKEIRDLVGSDASGGGGYSSIFGGGMYNSGPNGGRPMLSPDQSRRPTMGMGGYPGGSGYGMSQAQFNYPTDGFRMGGMGGTLGAAQAAMARFTHNTRGAGAGGATSYQYDHASGTYTSFNARGEAVERGMSPATVQQRSDVSQAAARGAGSSSLTGLVSSLPVVGPIASKLMAPLNELQRAGNFIGDQRAANAQYQSIYGPGTSGFDQRMHNFGGRFRNTMRNVGSVFGIGDGGLSDADYDTAFKATSAMGLQGVARERSINFATSNFNSTGMSVNDSLQLISTNLKQASSDFQDLGTQLKNVSQMAQDAGQSAEVFRQKFSQSYQTAVDSGFGSASATIATSQVGATAGHGRMFTGLDTSQMYSTLGNQQMLANRMGYSSVLDFSLATQQNPVVLAQAQDKQLDSVLAYVVPQSGRAAVEAAIKKQPGGAQSVIGDQQRAKIVVDQVETQAPNTLNSIAILSALQGAQIGLPSNIANNPDGGAIYYVQWVAGKMTGSNTFGGPAAKSVAADSRQVIGDKTAAAAFKRGDVGVATTSGGGLATSHTTRGAHGNYAKIAYTTNSKGQLVSDPVIGKLEKSGTHHVMVETANGPTVVTMTEAANKFRDQLLRGTATIVDGEHAGSQISDAYTPEQNVTGDSTNKKAPGNATFDRKTWSKLQGMGLDSSELEGLINARSGLKTFGGGSDEQIISLAKKMKAHSENGGATGSITVGLKPNVAKYLDIAVNGNSLVNTAAESGAPMSIDPQGASVKTSR